MHINIYILMSHTSSQWPYTFINVYAYLLTYVYTIRTHLYIHPYTHIQIYSHFAFSHTSIAHYYIHWYILINTSAYIHKHTHTHLHLRIAYICTHFLTSIETINPYFMVHVLVVPFTFHMRVDIFVAICLVKFNFWHVR